jgi:putative peptidoglycan lipid II flippase
VSDPSATVPGEGGDPGAGEPRRARRLARNTAFFSFATGLSRVAGLAREVVAASLFGVSGPMSAFTIAFSVPNLVRALFADSALQGAFVPIFTELLERGERREAFRLATSLFLLITLVLGSLTVVFVLVAPAVMPVFVPGFGPELRELTVGLSRLLFPIVLLLALSGLAVGMLNAFEHFSVPALAPLAWNGVIILALLVGPGLLPEGREIYAYAVGVLAGTVVQLLLPLPWLRGRGGGFSLSLRWSPAVGRVLALMVPVTVALGLINFSLVINGVLGTLVSDEVAAAIDKAFRLYMLPQGLFSVAIATILFPVLSRFAARGALGDLRRTMANGVGQICLLLIPSAVLLGVLAEPVTRVVYERGAFDAQATDLVAEALLWWSLSLPFQGVSLLFSRTFFSLQRPWATTALAALNMGVNVAVSAALFRPFGIAGIVFGTVVGTVAMTVAQGWWLRRALGGIEGGALLASGARMVLAALALAVAALGAWRALDAPLGPSLLGQVVAVGVAVVAGLAVYAGAVWALGVPEARQVRALVGGRLRRS